MNKHILKYEFEQRHNKVIHLIISKEHVDEYEEGDIKAFIRFLRKSLSEILGIEASGLPVQVANLEYNNDKQRAHWHIIFYTHPDIQDKLSQFLETKAKAAGYIATAIKKKIALFKGVSGGDITKLTGISVVKPEIKKYSSIDYAIKAGHENFVIMGLYVDESVDFDIWGNKATSDFYRKNCQGDSPEGGVRALYPGKGKGMLTKRPQKDDFDPEAVVNYFSELGHVPIEDEFRLYMYKQAGAVTFNKQHFELVRALLKDSLPVDRLINPRDKILDRVKQLDLLWSQLVEQLQTNFREKNEAAKYQHTYLKNAVKVSNSEYMQGIYKWVAEYLVVDQEDRESQKNKALIIEGASNSGKSALMEILFPNDIFGTRGLSMCMRYATEGMYKPGCHLWVYRDINRGLSTENMFRFQNLIDGDETLREICKAEMQNMYLSRPIIAATTTDIVKSFDERTASRDDLKDRVEQLVNRLVVVKVPDPKKDIVRGKICHVSELLKFLIYPEMMKMPKWVAFYLFWRHFFENEEKLREGCIAYAEDYGDFLSVASFNGVSSEVNSLLGIEVPEARDNDDDCKTEKGTVNGELSVCGLSYK